MDRAVLAGGRTVASHRVLDAGRLGTTRPVQPGRLPGAGPKHGDGPESGSQSVDESQPAATSSTILTRAIAAAPTNCGPTRWARNSPGAAAYPLIPQPAGAVSGVLRFQRWAARRACATISMRCAAISGLKTARSRCARGRASTTTCCACRWRERPTSSCRSPIWCWRPRPWTGPEHESLFVGDEIDNYLPMASANHMTGNPWYSTECCAGVEPELRPDLSGHDHPDAPKLRRRHHQTRLSRLSVPRRRHIEVAGISQLRPGGLLERLGSTRALLGGRARCTTTTSRETSRC